MPTLTLTNSQAPVHDSFVHDLAQWLANQTGLPTEFVTTGTWAEREAALDAGQIDMGWICGAPYVHKIAIGVPLDAIAAPVMAHPRYLDKPLYFSDVIVRADSRFHTFDDLEGTRWVYNEPHSHSGYHVVRHFLATHGMNGAFFGQVRASGSHQSSIQLVLNGQADAGAIDSTVLELLVHQDATLTTRLRMIAALGPSPMPPFVIGKHIPPNVRDEIGTAFARMHETPEGRAILSRAQMSRLARVTDRDYDAIRRMLLEAEGIRL